MNIHLAVMPLLAIISGILILIYPKIFHLVVAFYLITIGLNGLFGLSRIFSH